jgi:hypothetical protein
LPLILLAPLGRARRRPVRALVLTTAVSGVVVFVVSEPISYWLLHMSPGLDDVAHDTALWLLNNVVSQAAAKAFGFVFAVSLIATAGVLITQLASAARMASPVTEETAGTTRAAATVP